MIHRKTRRSLLAVGKYLLVQVAVFGVCGTDSAKSSAVASLPPATGPFAVGKVTLHWTDESRIEPLSPNHEPREVMVDIWYPAEPSNAVPADYLDAAAYEKAIGADGFQKFWCFRNRLLVAGSQPVVAKALAIDFEVAGSCGAKFDRNLLLPNILD
jgi:hypothetical protein